MTSDRASSSRFPFDVLVAGSWPFAVTVPMLLVFWAFTLRGSAWLFVYAGAVALCGLGAVLITLAKLSLLRRRVFLSFGTRRLPFGRCRRLYRRGWLLVAMGTGFAVLLLACSRP